MLIALLAGALTSSGGCALFEWTAQMTVPPPTQKVEAEFAGLPGKNVAVVVWTEMSTELEDPHLRGDLARYVQAAVKQNLENVTFVPQRKIHDYQQTHLRWADTPPWILGRQFEAEMVMMVQVTYYTLTRPGQLLYQQGRLTADCALYDLKRPRGHEKVWDRQNMVAQYPPEHHSSRVASKPSATRSELLKQFGELLARSFYEHKEQL